MTVEGGTDSVGPSDYNYDLSQRRANSVIQYLASEHNIPAHKIYLIGLGKDKPVETNKTSEGRAKNRRVDVRLMTNTQGDNATPAQPASPTARRIRRACKKQFSLLPGGLRQHRPLTPHEWPDFLPDTFARDGRTRLARWRTLHGHGHGAERAGSKPFARARLKVRGCLRRESHRGGALVRRAGAIRL